MTSTSLVTIASRIIGTTDVQTCSARDLHAFLGVAAQFTDWIKAQIERARLIENRDYLPHEEVKQLPSGAKTLKQYALTIEAAKHVAMLSQTDKGFEVREYFIECEKKVQKADPLATLPPEQRALIRLMVEQAETKQRVAITEEKVARIEAKQQAFEEGSKFFTVLGFFVWRALPAMSLAETAQFGKRATKLSKERGVIVDRVRDPRFGMVNSYHEDILQSVLDAFMAD
jgi:phage anti-repressor protein